VGAKYTSYRGWLSENFYLDICSYCLLQYRGSLSIDHYVPRKLAPERIDEPNNLLLSCQTCGRQKSDYHPEHRQRRRLPDDCSGFLVLDVRVDDLAQRFVIAEDGSLRPRDGLTQDARRRAAWNVALLRLDLRDEERARLREKLTLVQALRQVHATNRSNLEDRTLTILERELAEHLPAILAFGLPLTVDLHDRLCELVREARAATSSS
jgi:hypothetical protein